MQTLHVDPEFKSLIPPLTAEEYAALEQSILADGCRDAIVTWNGIIVDGHNRYEICTTHNVPFKTVSYNFDSRDEVKEWMILNQLARRNLQPFQYVELALRIKPVIEERAKAKLRKYYGNQYDGPLQKSAEVQKPINTREEIAQLAGVSRDTVAKVEKILEVADEETKDALRRGDMSINKAYNDIHKPHVAFNSGNNEWYTPKEYIEAARRVMGSIDLDPASSEIANKVVQAPEIYTIETDGLAHKWHGNVWLNPPYASELIKLFVEKVAAEAENISQAIILVNNATETKWFSELVKVSSAVIFPTGRVNFYKPDGSIGAPLQGQAVFYVGDNDARFLDEFKSFGWGVKLHE